MPSVTAAPHPFEFFSGLRWLDGRPLMDTIEPYRRTIFAEALFTFAPDGWPLYNRVLCGRAKKNRDGRSDPAALYRFLAWPSAAGNDCFIIANDEEQAGDDLSLAKKLITCNPDLDSEVTVYAKEIARRDDMGSMKILPARDVLGLHGKTFLFLGLDEIHGYRNYDVFEALSPDPTRLDALTWITTYAGIGDEAGIRCTTYCASVRLATTPGCISRGMPPIIPRMPHLRVTTWHQRCAPTPRWPRGDDQDLTHQKRRLPTHKYVAYT